MAMKNITVRVPESVYRDARVRAAGRGTSVSVLVSEFLRSVCGTGSEFARLEQRQREVQKRVTRLRATDRLSRDDIHDRAIR
jgi:plasmid stability protein